MLVNLVERKYLCAKVDDTICKHNGITKTMLKKCVSKNIKLFVAKEKQREIL